MSCSFPVPLRRLGLATELFSGSGDKVKIVGSDEDPTQGALGVSLAF